ncbi:cobalt-precorrin-6A reductase, partial [Burkholderia pseudomallei]|nr:cobalt-precorrin-6A reductase [Burkholderia pseudomallei]
ERPARPAADREVGATAALVAALRARRAP